MRLGRSPRRHPAAPRRLAASRRSTFDACVAARATATRQRASAKATSTPRCTTRCSRPLHPLPPIEPALSARAFVEALDADRGGGSARGADVADGRVPAAARGRARCSRRSRDAPPPTAAWPTSRDSSDGRRAAQDPGRAALAREYIRAMRFLYQKEFVAQRPAAPRPSRRCTGARPQHRHRRRSRISRPSRAGDAEGAGPGAADPPGADRRPGPRPRAAHRPDRSRPAGELPALRRRGLARRRWVSRGSTTSRRRRRRQPARGRSPREGARGRATCG